MPACRRPAARSAAGPTRLPILEAGTPIESWTAQNSRYQSGRFGMFLNSQQNATFSRPMIQPIDVVGTEYGQACPHLGGIAPEVIVSGSPQSAGDLTIRVESGRGGSAGFVMIGLSPAALQVSGCFLNLLPVLTLGPLPLSGSEPASGRGSLGLVVPNLGSSVPLMFQAGVLDPATPLGVVLSRGRNVVFSP